MLKLFLILTVSLLFGLRTTAQTDIIPYALNTTKENRIKEYRNLINNSINKNLSLSLTDSTEENWQDAFWVMELINYKSPYTDAHIRLALDSITKRSIIFQRALIELIYTNYSKEFIPQIVSFLKQTNNPKIFAMCAEYLLMNNELEVYKNMLLKRMDEITINFKEVSDNPFFKILKNKLIIKNYTLPPIEDLLNKKFLYAETVIFSFQRKNRNYPGLAMVRGKNGEFVKTESGNYFSVPQLARSITNMPGYLTNGNTPQGIFKMTGFDVSKSNFIGPTSNIQLVMPYENSLEITDSTKQKLGDNYTDLLPVSWRKYIPFYETYVAGKAGRTEIIAHGTTVNPAYYQKEIYYPLTPTQGCLCTKEIWSPTDGKRIESDQQKLVDVIKIAGGANGYCVVIEIDDKQQRVSIEDILPFLNKK